VGWAGLDSSDKCQAAVNKMMKLHFPKMGISCIDEKLRGISFLVNRQDIQKHRKKYILDAEPVQYLLFCVFGNLVNGRIAILTTRALKGLNITLNFMTVFWFAT